VSEEGPAPQAPRKRVDEDWKTRAQEEKEKFKVGQGAGVAQPQGGAAVATNRLFLEFLSGLATQALMALGEVPHPMTHQREADPEQARYLIETLRVLQEKTRGNLSDQERRALDGIVYELQMKYVQASSEASPGEPQGPNPN
jgi:hypothetical protein